jgi:ankyrin repeat protein
MKLSNEKAYKIFWIAVAVLLIAGGFYYRFRTNAADERGATVLMRSFEQPTDKRAVMRLIKHTKDLNKKDKAGQTALFYAVRHNSDMEIVRKLLDSGADVNCVDKAGRTALMLAARHNASLEIVRELLRRGALVEVVDNKGQTALLDAAQYATPLIVRALLRAGADPEAANKDGKTAADLISENEKFTDEEKNNYRQAMVVLSIIGPLRVIEPDK